MNVESIQLIKLQWDEGDDSESGEDEEGWGDDEEELGFAADGS